MLLAGIYRVVENQIEMTIITTLANESMKQIHQRMPLIITNEQMKPWLSKDNFKSILRIKPQPVKISSGILQASLF